MVGPAGGEGGALARPLVVGNGATVCKPSENGGSLEAWAGFFNLWGG